MRVVAVGGWVVLSTLPALCTLFADKPLAVLSACSSCREGGDAAWSIWCNITLAALCYAIARAWLEGIGVVWYVWSMRHPLKCYHPLAQEEKEAFVSDPLSRPLKYSANLDEKAFEAQLPFWRKRNWRRQEGSASFGLAIFLWISIAVAARCSQSEEGSLAATLGAGYAIAPWAALLVRGVVFRSDG